MEICHLLDSSHFWSCCSKIVKDLNDQISAVHHDAAGLRSI
jgi:hypothetical protein